MLLYITDNDLLPQQQKNICECCCYPRMSKLISKIFLSWEKVAIIYKQTTSNVLEVERESGAAGVKTTTSCMPGFKIKRNRIECYLIQLNETDFCLENLALISIFL